MATQPQQPLNEAQAIIHREVGTLIATWANTESLFTALFGATTGLSKENAALIYFALSSNYSRMQVLTQLIQSNMTETDRETALKLVHRMKAPTRTRNDLAHAEYHFDPQTFDYLGTWSKSREGGAPEYRKFDKNRMNEIKQAILALNALNADLLALILKLQAQA